jgi:hypothetical protein
MVAIGNADIRAFDKVVMNPFLGLGANLDKLLYFACILFVTNLDLVLLLRISCCPGLEEERTREKVEERRRKNRKKRENITKRMQHKEDREDSI